MSSRPIGFVTRAVSQTPDRITAEYALRNTATPIAVAEFVTALPPGLAESLPTVERTESELAPLDMLLQHAGRLNRALHVGTTQQGEEEQV
jgi:hypothetical protein